MNYIILVIEDQPTNLKLALDLLVFEGHRVLQASDAEQALAILDSTLPDLILIDIALPGMDGLTLTRQLKSTPRTKNICIVALTAFAMKGDQQKAFDAGCDGYITKPIDTRFFAAHVEKFISGEPNKVLSGNRNNN